MKTNPPSCCAEKDCITVLLQHTVHNISAQHSQEKPASSVTMKKPFKNILVMYLYTRSLHEPHFTSLVDSRSTQVRPILLTVYQDRNNKLEENINSSHFG
jgi:hypothetical protein